MISKKGLVWSLIILVGLVSLLYAPSLRIWKVSTKEELIKGEPLSTSISSEGKVTLAPTAQEIYAPPEPYLWSAVIDSKGNLYVGSGDQGKVFQVDRQGTGRLFFDSEELEVHALLVDKNDNLLVATSPNGNLYRVSPEGKSTVLFEPREKYIWSLAMDQQGNIYAGTGTRGRIYKIDSQGKGELFWESQQTHIIFLTMDNKGNLLAGSDPGAHIYRISPQAKGFVLYDSPLQEVRSVVSDKKGNINNNIPPILERLNIDTQQWHYLTTQFESQFKTLWAPPIICDTFVNNSDSNGRRALPTVRSCSPAPEF